MSNTFQNAQVLMPVQDLTNLFRDLIREEINAKNKKELQEKFLSPKDTCALFTPNITLPTLESYVQRGLLKKYYLGGRTWFKYTELLDAMKEIKRFSRNNPVAA